METTITMTSRAQRRAWVLTRVLKHELTMTEAADLVGLSERQLWRLRVAFERDGPAGLVHGNRGRPSGRRLEGSLRARVIDLRRTTYAQVNDTHLAELLAEREGIEISRPSLQRILRAAGLASPAGVDRRGTAAGVSGCRPKDSCSSSTAAVTSGSRSGVHG